MTPLKDLLALAEAALDSSIGGLEYTSRNHSFRAAANPAQIIAMCKALDLAREALEFYAGNSKGPYVQQSPSEVWYGNDSGNKARSTIAAINAIGGE